VCQTNVLRTAVIGGVSLVVVRLQETPLLTTKTDGFE
jgi:hypothetical protein